MLKIYLASAFANQAALRGLRRAIESLGHEVTSRWLDEKPEDAGDEERNRRCAIYDIDDIDRADVLILWPDNERHRTSGKFVELGYALGRGKKVYIVEPGTTTCIFKLLPAIEHVANWAEMMEILIASSPLQRFNFAL